MTGMVKMASDIVFLLKVARELLLNFLFSCYPVQVLAWNGTIHF